MKPSYSFVYFDLDDTLLNHEQAEHLALNDVWEEFKLKQFVSQIEFKKTYHKINVVLWEQYGSGEIGRDELQKTRFQKTLSEIGVPLSWKTVGDRYLVLYQTHWAWLPNAKETFYKIKEQFPVGILTNGFAETQKAKLRLFDLDVNDIVNVISEEVGILKPQPGVFEAATRYSGVPLSQILYVGDSFTSDVLGGTNYGWDVAWFTKETNKEKLQKSILPFSDFKDLLRFLNID